MQIRITEEAKGRLGNIIKESKLSEPALRIIFAGMG